jgi:hypothetical protein
MIAAMNANYPIVKLLANLGANLTLESVDGKLARDFALDALAEA